ncbi:unnamed protein product [Trichogramma brassicae]|uniref:Uncharacterized protein n=1 Tax=Trichogramma brassicae TaxID=86971 RepID=A0A6H5IE83_9HYME|nr:unnamed protein product [Trichogramma brassicae]
MKPTTYICARRRGRRRLRCGFSNSLQLLSAIYLRRSNARTGTQAGGSRERLMLFDTLYMCRIYTATKEGCAGNEGSAREFAGRLNVCWLLSRKTQAADAATADTAAARRMYMIAAEAAAERAPLPLHTTSTYTSTRLPVVLLLLRPSVLPTCAGKRTRTLARKDVDVDDGDAAGRVCNPLNIIIEKMQQTSPSMHGNRSSSGAEAYSQHETTSRRRQRRLRRRGLHQSCTVYNGFVYFTRIIQRDGDDDYDETSRVRVSACTSGRVRFTLRERTNDSFDAFTSCDVCARASLGRKAVATASLQMKIFQSTHLCACVLAEDGLLLARARIHHVESSSSSLQSITLYSQTTLHSDAYDIVVHTDDTKREREILVLISLVSMCTCDPTVRAWKLSIALFTAIVYIAYTYTHTKTLNFYYYCCSPISLSFERIYTICARAYTIICGNFFLEKSRAMYWTSGEFLFFLLSWTPSKWPRASQDRSLHIATIGSKICYARLLLNAGADVKRVNHEGDTVLNYILHNGEDPNIVKTVELSLNRGSEPYNSNEARSDRHDPSIIKLHGTLSSSISIATAAATAATADKVASRRKRSRRGRQKSPRAH